MNATVKCILEQGREEGLEQGLEQGLERGRVLNCRDGVYQILTDRFGACPEDVRELIDACDDLTILYDLFRASYSYETLDDFIIKVDALLK